MIDVVFWFVFVLIRTPKEGGRRQELDLGGWNSNKRGETALTKNHRLISEEPKTEDEQETSFEEEFITRHRFKMGRERGEFSSIYHPKSKNYEFSMPYHKGIPNSETARSNTINTINIDCIFDLQKKQEVIDKWNTEISLIIQSNPDEFVSSKAVLLLIEHKSAGIIKYFIKKTSWNEDMHGEDTFDAIIKALYVIPARSHVIFSRVWKEIPLKVIISPEPFIKKKENIIEFKKNFSKTAVKSKEEIEEEKDFISLDEFRIVWSKARALSQDEFETKHLYTEDKATKSLIICCPGSSPEMVSLAFSAGLIKFIYPSPNLLEISLFPEGMKKAIKNFRKKIAAARDANIYIKCTTLPDWFQGRFYPSYHHLEIGIAKTRTQKEIGQRRRKKKGAKGNHRTSEGGRPKVNRECRNFRSLEGRLGSWETGNRKRRRLEEGPIGYCGLRLQYSDFRPDIPAILELQIGGLLGWCPTSAFLVLTDSLSGSGSQGCLKYAPGSTQTHEFRDVSKKIGAVEPFTGNLATCWNNIKEEEALERYKLITGNSVMLPEFHVSGKVNQEDNWLGASPDGIINKIVYGLPHGGILEIKCPFYKGDMRKGYPWSQVPYNCIPQAQGLMEILDRDWMDFYVWTPKGSSLIRINRDVEYWKVLKITLSDFWWDHVQPAREIYCNYNVKDPVSELKSLCPAPKHELCSHIMKESRRVVGNSRLLMREIHGKLMD
ncbi:hypothetical protein E3N88_36682 [Mikania micrantha]|uniref:YqaJ viral recombinase domain-containing protein n=1 Tax=Mikania micrantha TaxID=192012 RepID=A0A5N6M4X7_9ASTR|nr:hypothetical protein E3N88_36682 [Mikania micrantha]